MLRRHEFVLAHVSWMLLGVVGLTLFGLMSLQAFAFVAFVGFLGLVALTAPATRSPEWRRRLKWFVALVVVVFGYAVFRRVAGKL
jgi:hypothetical protein